MVTQGIVSIVQNNKTIIKAVAGCNGYNAKNLAEIIRFQKLSTAQEVYDAATRIGFGCEECLVVMDENNILFSDKEDDLPYYRETFSKPRFNPRWECGIADHIQVVHI